MTSRDVVKVGTVPTAIAYHDTTQTAANGSTTVIAMNNETLDTDGIHDTVTNNSRLTAQTAGRYHVFGNIEFPTDANGSRQIALRVNGTDYKAVAEIPAVSGAPTLMNISVEVNLAAADYVEFTTFVRGAAGNLTIPAATAANPYRCCVGMFRIGD